MVFSTSSIPADSRLLLRYRIKAFTPVSVLLVSAAFRLKELNARILCIVGVISLGVTIASYGEIDFELIGFLVQVSF